MHRNANLWTPLDCAAAKGWVDAATVLLDADCPVDPTDKAKVKGTCNLVPRVLSFPPERILGMRLREHAGENTC